MKSELEKAKNSERTLKESLDGANAKYEGICCIVYLDITNSEIMTGEMICSGQSPICRVFFFPPNDPTSSVVSNR